MPGTILNVKVHAHFIQLSNNPISKYCYYPIFRYTVCLSIGKRLSKNENNQGYNSADAGLLLQRKEV